MPRFDEELAASLILSGSPPEDAIRSACEPDSLFDKALRIASHKLSIGDKVLPRFHVPDGGSLGKVPDPRCVARELKGNPRPTREDVQRAFAKCSG